MTINGNATVSPKRFVPDPRWTGDAIGPARCCGKTKGLWPDTDPRRCKHVAMRGYFTCERHVEQIPLPFGPERFTSDPERISVPCDAAVYGFIKEPHRNLMPSPALKLMDKPPQEHKHDEPIGGNYLAGVLDGLMRSVTKDTKETVLATDWLETFSHKQEWVAYVMGYLKAAGRDDLANFLMNMAKTEGLFKDVD